MSKSFYHTGEYGDIIAALPSIRAFGGGDIVLGKQQPPYILSNQNVIGIDQERFGVIAPLLQAQSYITNVELGFRSTDYDFSVFRQYSGRIGDTLADWQARVLQIANLDTSPWLTVPNLKRNDRIVLARSFNYTQPNFPWTQIIKKYKQQTLFLGLSKDHEELESITNTKIEFAPTSNFLEAAQLIAGARFGIYTSSALGWIAIGLGCPAILENREVHTEIVTQNNSYCIDTPSKINQLKDKLANSEELF